MFYSCIYLHSIKIIYIFVIKKLTIKQWKYDMDIDVDYKHYYEFGKPESIERTRERLTEIRESSMVELGFSQFGVPEVMSGLYIEKVWNYSQEDWDDYMNWAKRLINK